MSPSTSTSFRPVSLLLLFLLFSQLVESLESRKVDKKSSNSVSAVFVFGDSTVDSGNNNYIPTVAKGNFPPYGRDFPNHIPTGRFTNGKLVTDFVASYLGIKDYIPPYLDPRLSIDDLMTGVSFASALTGFDPLTAQLSGVISMQKQLNYYFKEYKSRIEMYTGKERANKLINNAVFLISAGTNDFIMNYYGPLPIRRHTYNISSYQNFILQQGKQFIQDLLEMGARKIAFVGLPPIGCVPIVITLNSHSLSDRVCIERLSSTARDYNTLLQKSLADIIGPTIFYVDIYKPVDDMVKNPQQFGFDVVDRGCCGSGMLEAALLCNKYSPVCSNDSVYVFWDSVHPSQATYYNIFRAVRPLVDRIIKA
ncbi:hypothetical protein ACS0TY_031401 [Phlomoides rotata]